MKVIKSALTIQLQPYTIPMLFGAPASHLYEKTIPLKDFDQNLSVQLEDFINSDSNSDEILVKCEEILKNRIIQTTLDERVKVVFNKLIEYKGITKVSNLINHLNLSQRRFQQLLRRLRLNN